jgi:hypothetical protein
MRDPRDQIVDRINRLQNMRDQMRELTGDDTISFREGGIVSIGGEGGIILGGTDARAYAEPVATGVPPKANPPGTRSVMDCMADEGDFTVHGDYDTTFFTSLGMQPKKFYRLQVLRSADGFGVAMNYGRQGEPGKAGFLGRPTKPTPSNNSRRNSDPRQVIIGATAPSFLTQANTSFSRPMRVAVAVIQPAVEL